MYSWNDQKPTVTVGTVVTYNIAKHSNKGSAAVNLLGGLPVPPTIPADAKQFTVGVSDVSQYNDLPKQSLKTLLCMYYNGEPLIADTLHSCLKMAPKY